MKFATHMADVILHPNHHGSSSSENMTASLQTAQHEKQFIAHFSEQQRPLPPDEIAQDPRNKELGRSSRSLSVHDFELVRTLGTGAWPS